MSTSVRSCRFAVLLRISSLPLNLERLEAQAQVPDDTSITSASLAKLDML